MDGLLITIGFITTVVALGFALIGVVSYVIDEIQKHNQKRRKIKTEQIEAVACFLIHEYGLNKDEVHILRDRVAVSTRLGPAPSQWGGIIIERIK